MVTYIWRVPYTCLAFSDIHVPNKQHSGLGIWAGLKFGFGFLMYSSLVGFLLMRNPYNLSVHPLTPFLYMVPLKTISR